MNTTARAGRPVLQQADVPRRRIRRCGVERAGVPRRAGHRIPDAGCRHHFGPGRESFSGTGV